MATIEATVVETENGQVKVSASRSGGCANCAQKQSCAVLWQPSEKDHNVAVCDDSSEKQVGDNVTVQCNETALLSYIATLFLPTLLLLLGTTLVLEALTPGLPLVLKVVLNFILPLLLGTMISQKQLKKNEHRLLSATEIVSKN